MTMLTGDGAHSSKRILKSNKAQYSWNSRNFNLARDERGTIRKNSH
jgi:hypothetical protein